MVCIFSRLPMPNDLSSGNNPFLNGLKLLMQLMSVLENSYLRSDATVRAYSSWKCTQVRIYCSCLQ